MKGKYFPVSSEKMEGYWAQAHAGCRFRGGCFRLGRMGVTCLGAEHGGLQVLPGKLLNVQTDGGCH